MTHPIPLLSAAAAGLLTFMVLFGIAEGASQQQFELVDTLANYSAELLAQANAIRIIIGFDNVFIALYTSVIVLIIVQLKRDNKAPRELLYTILGCGLIAGSLDFLENFHILTMLSGIEVGVAIDPAEMKQQMIWSMLKWHLSYFAFFLMAFALHPRTLLERLFCFSLLFIQMPVGVFFYILEGSTIGDILFYARYGNLVFGFLIIGAIFHMRANPSMTTSNNIRDNMTKTSLAPH